MDAVVMELTGKSGPSAFSRATRALGAPGPGQALVKVLAAGVSFAEVQMQSGRYPGQPAFPFVPGYDLVGTVVAVGAGVPSSLVGRRVAALTETGAWATAVMLEARSLVPVPDTLDAGEAASLVVNGATAWKMLHRVARVSAGDTVVVHGAAGGVGSLLVQLARIAGARVIGTASARHLDAVRGLGAEAIDYRTADVAAEVKALAPGGVSAVFDHVGGASLARGWEMLGPRGRLVAYGSASTRNAQGSPWIPILRTMAQTTLWNLLPGRRRAAFFDVWGRGSLGANRILRPARYWAELAADLGEVFALLEKGAIRAPIAARLDLEEAAEALRFHESGRVPGKVLLVPGMKAHA